MGIKKKILKDSKIKPEDTQVNSQPPGVKFYSLIDIVKTDRIMDEVKEGNLIFLNINRISACPERKNEFLQSLKKTSAELHATLKMVSNETLMIAPSTVPVEIRSLSPTGLRNIKFNSKE
ncbi:MAG: cell division protein SepF [Candidatus Heimdallarchaeota archaeon]|jgi:SepF-like predicted cell division protein (DUF552 family)|nr:cell division protein SepF [Candidatus Heimdallarchaeota archaeon]MCK4610640.1 cell division protein SepF [Candidatus Heimdallarchaeota archaeon]